MQVKFDHIAVNVKDIEKSIEWYVENLEADITYQDNTWALMTIGGIKLALTVPSQHDPHIAFKVKDISQFNDDEIKVHRDGVKYVYKRDPDGNCIEWVCYK
tara:strand:- start:5878 stop:6180 length:303 start_codon:yes stop_codon:yes gene_type:complete